MTPLINTIGGFKFGGMVYCIAIRTQKKKMVDFNLAVERQI